MRALCIDPGSEKSAIVRVSVAEAYISPPWGVTPLSAEEVSNEELRLYLHEHAERYEWLVIEMMTGVFSGSTARDQLRSDGWGHRFIEAFIRANELAGEYREGEYLVARISSSTRRAAVLGTAKGNDSMNRRALIDMYGGDAEAFGKKCSSCKGRGWVGRDHASCPGCSGEGWDPPRGPLHGWTGTHLYAALGCAIAAFQPGGPGRPRTRAQELLQGLEGSGELASTLRRPRPNPGGQVPRAHSLEELDRWQR